MRVRIAIAMVGAASAVVARPAPADACSCGPPDIVAPTFRATDVPTNLAEIVIIGFANLGDPSLVGPSESVPLGPPGVPMNTFGIHRFAVLAELQPETEYSVVFPGFTTTFTTGAGRDRTIPLPLEISGLRLARADFARPNLSCTDRLARADATLLGRFEPLIDVTFLGADTAQHYVLPSPTALGAIRAPRPRALQCGLAISPGTSVRRAPRARRSAPARTSRTAIYPSTSTSVRSRAPVAARPLHAVRGWSSRSWRSSSGHADSVRRATAS